MKVISRNVTVYAYKFANVDLDTGNIANVMVRRTVVPMSLREIQRYGTEHNVFHVRTDKEVVRYVLPLERFVEAATAYAAENGEIDEQEDDNSESGDDRADEN